MIAHVRYGHFILVNSAGDCALLTNTFHQIDVFADFGQAEQAAKRRAKLAESQRLAEEAADMDELDPVDAASRENTGE